MHYLGYIQFAFEALYLHLIRKARLYTALAILVFVGIPLVVLGMPPQGFPVGAHLTIPEDASFGEIAEELEEQHLISSAFMLKALARVTGNDRGVKAGRYVFEEPIGVGVMLYRFARGISGVHEVRITFPEGVTVRDMGEILHERIPGFDTTAFIQEATPYEGYLFPDTYDIYVDASPEEVIDRMRRRFDEVWEHLDRGNSRESKDRVVTMASLLEKETKVGTDRSIVSGILWKRISIGMALQVDAVFGYIKNKDTYHPSGDDLDIDSPYNTYKYPDLPPGPIGNPGEDALYAALHPTASKNLYYLTGKDGGVHYGTTFEEHKRNKELYLR